MTPPPAVESPYAWWRLAISLALMTLGGVGMYSVTVVLSRIQADFGVDRGDLLNLTIVLFLLRRARARGIGLGRPPQGMVNTVSTPV